LITKRGKELSGDDAQQLVEALVGAMKSIHNEQTLNGSLHSLKTLATYHLEPTLIQFLDVKPPHEV